MDPELAARLERLSADHAAKDARPDFAVPPVCDLLVAGLDSPALRTLAGESVRMDEVLVVTP